MYKLNCLNYKYNNYYYFQIDSNKCIKINDTLLIEKLKNKESFLESELLDMLGKDYSAENIKFFTEKNLVIKEDDYRNILIDILEKLIYHIEYSPKNDNINSIFVYSNNYGYRSINIVKSAIELGIKFTIERNYKNDMKIKFENGYIYDINTNYHIYNENICAINIARSKSLTSHFLQSHDIKVPKKRLFYINDLSEIEKFIDKIRYPICIKPDDSCQGQDVFPNIINKIEFERVINYYNNLYKEFIVEESIIGKSYRLFFCYGEIIGAIYKPKRFIIGDGLNTIEFLIEQKYKYNDISVYDEEFYLMLDRNKLNLKHILPLNCKLVISNKGTSNDFVDFDIKNLNPYYNILALKVSKALGLNIFAIDLISDSLNDVSGNLPTINEIQEGPEFGRGDLNVNKFYNKVVKILSKIL